MRSGVMSAFGRHSTARRGVSTVFTIIFIVFAGALVSGCAIKLAPSFDQAIFDGLTKANEDAMTLFASLSNGAPQKTFPSRKPAYDIVIGELNALSVQIQARVAPPTPGFISALIKPLSSVPAIPDVSPASSCFALVPVVAPVAPAAATTPSTDSAPTVPTASAVQCMTFALTTMRDADANHGLGPKVVALFKLRFAFFMTNALAYEKALNR